jgi:MoaA/NifB/PqqE/SkfB family radical SAM enzyme
VLKGAVRYLGNRLRGRPSPLSATILLTFACNLRCHYCDFPARKSRHMTREQLLDLVNRLARGGTVRYSISGGEPMLRDELSDVLREIRRLGGISSVTTNATLVHEKIEMLDAAHYVLTTIEGDEAVHDGIRGAGMYRRTVEGLELIKKTYPRIKLGIITALNKRNVHAVDATLELARALRCRVHFQPVQPVHPWGGDSDTVLAPEVVSALYRRLIDLKKSGAPIANSHAYLKFVREHPFGVPDQHCHTGRHVATILPDGRMVNCCIIMGARRDWPNVLQDDPGTCLERISVKHCDGCTIAPYVENNLLLDMNASAWMEIVRWR